MLLGALALALQQSSGDRLSHVAGDLILKQASCQVNNSIVSSATQSFAVNRHLCAWRKRPLSFFFF